MTTKSCKCLCGVISFKAELKNGKYAACHCNMCRQWGSGPMLAIPAAISDVKGEDNITAYTSSDWAERTFCKTCGTNLYYKVTAPGPHQGVTHISVGLIEDQTDMQLVREIFIDEKPEGYNYAGNLKQMTGEEVFAAVMQGEEI